MSNLHGFLLGGKDPVVILSALCGEEDAKRRGCTNQLAEVGGCEQLAGGSVLAVKLSKSLLGGECRGRSSCRDATDRSVGPSFFN